MKTFIHAFEDTVQLNPQGDLEVMSSYGYHLFPYQKFVLNIPTHLTLSKDLLPPRFLRTALKQPKLLWVTMAYWHLLKSGRYLKTHADFVLLDRKDKDNLLRIMLKTIGVNLFKRYYYYQVLTELNSPTGT